MTHSVRFLCGSADLSAADCPGGGLYGHGRRLAVRKGECRPGLNVSRRSTAHVPSPHLVTTAIAATSAAATATASDDGDDDDDDDDDGDGDAAEA